MTAPWLGREVIVVVGTGGVGKTSVAATLGALGAFSGRRTLVMTIDPARRLAQALGLDDRGGGVRRVPPAPFEEVGFPLRSELFVLMPEVRRVFDTLVERLTDDPRRRAAIFENRMYQSFASLLAGSLEYAAVEQLYMLREEREYDLIVLDTPPATQARSFIEAPLRVVDFLQHDALRWFIAPYRVAGRVSMRLVDLGTRFILRTLGRYAGVETLRELATFVLHFEGLYQGFAERAAAVRDLLRSDEVGVVLVGGTRTHQRRALSAFAPDLVQAELEPRAVVLNRLAPRVSTGDAMVATTLATRALEGFPYIVRSEILRAIEAISAASRWDELAIETIRREAWAREIFTLEELPRDVHDVEGIVQLAWSLAAQADSPEGRNGWKGASEGGRQVPLP